VSVLIETQQSTFLTFVSRTPKFIAVNRNRRIHNHFLSPKMAVFWVVAPCSLVEVYQRFRGPCCFHHQDDRPQAARSSDSLVNFYQTTRRYNPEDSHLRTHRRENLNLYLESVELIHIRCNTVLLILRDQKRNKDIIKEM
jgi:hypothetical protein